MAIAKREVFPVRMNIGAKRIIENAAGLIGTTVNAFLLHYAYLAATEILKENHLALSSRDWNAFAQALDNPPKPNAKLKKLLASDHHA